MERTEEELGEQVGEHGDEHEQEVGDAHVEDEQVDARVHRRVGGHGAEHEGVAEHRRAEHHRVEKHFERRGPRVREQRVAVPTLEHRSPLLLLLATLREREIAVPLIAL